MKKQNILIISAILLLIIGLTLLIILGKPKQNTTQTTYLNKTTYNVIVDKLKRKESFILYIGSKTCSNCTAFKPILKEALEELKVEAYEIDIAEFTKEQHDEIFTYVNTTTTPTVAFIESGRENFLRQLNGNRYTKEQIIETLNKSGFVK